MCASFAALLIAYLVLGQASVGTISNNSTFFSGVPYQLVQP